MVDRRVSAALERRSSGASGTHADRRTKRLRDRGSARRSALKEQQS